MGHVDPTKEVFAQFRDSDRPGPIHMRGHRLDSRPSSLPESLAERICQCKTVRKRITQGRKPVLVWNATRGLRVAAAEFGWTLASQA